MWQTVLNFSKNWCGSYHTQPPSSNSPVELSFATIHRTCWFRARILVTVFGGHISQHQFFTRYRGWTGVQILSFSTWVAWGFHWKTLHRCIWWLVSITWNLLKREIACMYTVEDFYRRGSYYNTDFSKQAFQKTHHLLQSLC